MASNEIDAHGDERTQLTQFLDYFRGVLLAKTADLGRSDMARTIPPSTMTLAGLLKHMTVVEESWFNEDFLGLPLGEPWASVDWEADRDWEWRTALDDDPDDLRDRYQAACERSRWVVAATESLDQVSVASGPDGTGWNLRWILIHMIEETARHCGHADLLRETIDGRTGDS